jgi:hypothetical protein
VKLKLIVLTSLLVAFFYPSLETKDPAIEWKDIKKDI